MIDAQKSFIMAAMGVAIIVGGIVMSNSLWDVLTAITLGSGWIGAVVMDALLDLVKGAYNARTGVKPSE